MNNNLHNLKKYCMPPFEKRLRAYILVCGIFAVLLFPLLAGLIPDSVTLWLFLSFPATLVICRHHVTVVPRKRLNRKLAQCRKDSTLNVVLRNFNTGARISKGTLITGQDCMFGQGYGLFVFYHEIEKYSIRSTTEQKIIDKNHDTMETVSRDFLDVCVNGKWYCLCEYYESSDANVRFHEFLHSKNSGIVYENKNQETLPSKIKMIFLLSINLYISYEKPSREMAEDIRTYISSFLLRLSFVQSVLNKATYPLAKQISGE